MSAVEGDEGTAMTEDRNQRITPAGMIQQLQPRQERRGAKLPSLIRSAGTSGARLIATPEQQQCSDAVTMQLHGDRVHNNC